MQLDTTILAPAAALAGWTMIVFLWMLSRRLPAFAAAGINLSDRPRRAGPDAGAIGVLRGRALPLPASRPTP